MNGVKLLGGVAAGEAQDGGGAGRVLVEEVGYIVDDAVQDDPAALAGVVLGDWNGVSKSGFRGLKVRERRV